MKLPTKTNGEKWDWDNFKSSVSEQGYQFHYENWDKPVSEAEYLAFEMNRPSCGKPTSPSHRRRNTKRRYHNLRNKWGFFPQPTNFLG